MLITVNTTISSSAAISWGWNASLDLDTTGDYFVDAVNGDDTNAGTSTGAAFATIQKAVDTIGSGGTGTISVMGDGVKYRENINIVSGQDNANRIVIKGHGTDKPIITGGEPITGWVQCTSADQAVVGPNYASIYKSTGLAKSNIASSNPLLLNLFENNTQMQICVGWQGGDLGDKFFMSNPSDGYTSDATNVDGSNNILSYTDTSVTSAFTAAQLENCHVIGHTTPNISFLTTVASVSGSTIVISDQTKQYEDNSNKDQFILLNLLPTMEQGQFGFVDQGTTVDVYCWPTDPANLTADMEYNAREQCISCFSANNWTVEGIRFQQVAGIDPGNRAGAFILQPAAQSAENVTIQNCHFYGKFGVSSGLGPAALQLNSIDNLKVHNNTLDRMQGSFGIAVYGDVNSPIETSVLAQDFDCQQNLITRCGAAGVRIYTQENAVVAHNKIVTSGADAHANKMNCYEQCHNFLLWGNIFVDVDGYLTWQEASGGHVLFNFLTATRQSGTNTTRAFVDQNNTTIPPSSWKSVSGEFLVANNTFLPQPIAYDGTASNTLTVTDTLGSTNASVTFTVMGNLYHGHEVPVPARITAWTGNWNTGPDGNYTAGNTAADGADVFTDPSNGDFTIKAGAAIRSATGPDLTSKIAAMQALFPQFSNWNLDCLGNTFTASAPPVGPVAGYDYSTLIGTTGFKVF